MFSFIMWRMTTIQFQETAGVFEAKEFMAWDALNTFLENVWRKTQITSVLILKTNDR